MNKSTLINLIFSGILILSLGLFTGYSIGYSQAKTNSFSAIKPVEELNPGIATLKFMKYENGKIYGQIAGQKARIAYSTDHIYDLAMGENFEIPLNQINLGMYYSAQDVPEGVNFIASKSGKYYYHVLDPRAIRITPKNRMYFKAEQEALGEGFIPPK